MKPMTVIVRNIGTDVETTYRNITTVQSAKDAIVWLCMSGDRELTVTVWRNSSVTLQSVNDAVILWVRGE